MSQTQTTISIDKITKKRAELLAQKMHLSVSGVARILLNDFADGKIKITTIMVNPDENNFSTTDKKELDKALSDLKLGKNIEGPFNNAKDLIKSLRS